MKSKNFSAAILSAVIVSGLAVKVLACCSSFPSSLLDVGDGAVLQSPVADFERELVRMKVVKPTAHAVPPGEGQKFYEQSAEVEMADLAAALRRQKSSEAQAAVIMQIHIAERMKLNAFYKAKTQWANYNEWGSDERGYHKLANTNPPPVFPAVAVTPGLPREFALYFQGAIAWQKNGDFLPPDRWQAGEDWAGLLALPPKERHFKSTWAAFMLGKIAEAEAVNSANEAVKPGDSAWWHCLSMTNQYNEAATRYRQVRELARDGFADSAGLATASLGLEARVCLRQKNYERAIELYLEQFAAGDDTAANSLRFAAGAALGQTNVPKEQFILLAKNSQTRRVLTAYLISRDYMTSDPTPTEANYEKRPSVTDVWLGAVEAAGVKDVESASQFALMAYQAGKMETAQRWINRAGSDPVAQWLQAKLFMRAGKISDAAKLLAKLSRKLPQNFSATNTPTGLAGSLYVSIDEGRSGNIGIGRQTFGELGVLRLARREYTEALDALLRSGYWMDAAYVAERVLTTAELKTYVDRNWPAVTSARLKAETVETDDSVSQPAIRSLLARRLARETACVEARDYFPVEVRTNYNLFIAGLRDGADKKMSDTQRARALFKSACLARENGMEMLGTELDPDWAIHGGAYEGGVSWSARTNCALVFQVKINLADTNEIARAIAHGVNPEKRFHYRYRAAALAWEAASFLPDNSDETARMLCTAGGWLKNRDPQAADKFYKALVRRCGQTAIGRQANWLRWFPDLSDDGATAKAVPQSDEPLPPEKMRAMTYTNGYGRVFYLFPVPGEIYRVQPGDTLTRIARIASKFGQPVTVSLLMQTNQLAPGAVIKVGQMLKIPATSATPLPAEPAPTNAVTAVLP